MCREKYIFRVCIHNMCIYTLHILHICRYVYTLYIYYILHICILHIVYTHSTYITYCIYALHICIIYHACTGMCTCMCVCVCVCTLSHTINVRSIHYTPHPTYIVYLCVHM